MLLLSEFAVMNPSFGLMIWAAILFLFVWVVVGRTGFKPIAESLEKREKSIEEALQAAKDAEEQMKNLQSKHGELLKQAREERLQIIKKAEAKREEIVEASRAAVDEQIRKRMEEAKLKIDKKRDILESQLYDEAGAIATAIAERIMNRSFEGKHDAFIAEQVDALRRHEIEV